MLVIGIDPGTATTGYGLIRETVSGVEAVDYGVITTSAQSPMDERLLSLYQQLNALVLLHQPDSGAVEKLFFSRNVTTAITVGQARGVVILKLAEEKIPVFEYTPMEVKMAVTGYGSAGKRQVQEMVRELLNLNSIPKPDDAADALAIAICHLNNSKFSQLTRLYGE